MRTRRLLRTNRRTYLRTLAPTLSLRPSGPSFLAELLHAIAQKEKKKNEKKAVSDCRLLGREIAVRSRITILRNTRIVLYEARKARCTSSRLPIDIGWTLHGS